MAIKDLTVNSSVKAGDSFPLYDATNSVDRRASLTAILTYIQANLTFPSEAFTTQYSSPSATGFSVTVTDGDDNDENIHLILTPVAGYAAGTIVLPAAPTDKQEVLVNCTQAVTTLTVDGGTKTVTGEPSTLAANDFFRLKFDAPSDVWYRVG